MAHLHISCDRIYNATIKIPRGDNTQFEYVSNAFVDFCIIA